MIIGISGYIGSGKDEVCKIIQANSSKRFENKKFAYKLKQMVSLLIGCSVEQLESQEFKSKHLGEEWKRNGVFLTPRIMLQELGTECVRDIIHPNAWCNALFSEYGDNSNWIITDCRFSNEAKSIKDNGGLLFRVNRGRKCSDHPSEISLDDYTEWDEVIDNNGTLQQLAERVLGIIYKYKI